MTKPQHTPLPWHTDQCTEYTIHILPDHLAFDGRRTRQITEMTIGWDGDNGFIEDSENKANADFIVRACNSHYELIEKLKWATEKLEELGQKNHYSLGMCRSVIACRDAIAKGEA